MVLLLSKTRQACFHWNIEVPSLYLGFLCGWLPQQEQCSQELHDLCCLWDGHGVIGEPVITFLPDSYIWHMEVKWPGQFAFTCLRYTETVLPFCTSSVCNLPSVHSFVSWNQPVNLPSSSLSSCSCKTDKNRHCKIHHSSNVDDITKFLIFY